MVQALPPPGTQSASTGAHSGLRTIKVVIVDDHRVVLDSVADRVGRCEDIEVVGTAANGDDGLRMALERRPDLVLLDVEFPGRGAFEVAEEIVTRMPETRVAFLSGHLSDVFLEQALKVGARGYMLKGDPLQKLIDGIRSVHAGEFFFSPDAYDRLVYDDIEKRYTVRHECKLSILTSRQIEVLRHLARGDSVKEVARKMALSEKSIDSHKYRIMNRLDIHDRVELARFAIREGLSLP